MLFILLQIQNILCGTLWPTSDSITLSISNRYEYADYTFKMIPESAIPVGGELQIIFPSQYLSGLGIDLVLDDTCSHVCSISGYLVRFYMENDILINETITVKINNVKNPERKGGTGNFIVRSKLGQNVFDENLIFGTVGIADYALDLNSMIIKIDENSTNIVNEIALYNFFIKPPIDLPQGFYLQITSPLTSDLTTCKLIPFNSITLSGEIKCENGIIVTGFSSVPALFTFGIQINFKNPPYSQTTESFRIVAYRKNTKMAYSWRSAVDGLYIQPSQFINITITPGSKKTTIISDYKLNFKIKNAVPTTGSIIVKLPLNFELANGYDYIFVTSGIVSDTLKISSTMYQFIITEFYEIPQYSDIEIIFRVVNPQIAGQSQSFIVQTTYDKTNIIEQCTNLTVNIIEVTTYTPVTATLTSPYANSATNLQFTINSIKNVAIKIVINFGPQWQYQVTTPTTSQCQLGGTSSSLCELANSTLTMTFPVTVSGIKTVDINGILKAPPYALNQFLIYDTFDSSNVDVESGSVKIIINPKQDSGAQFIWYGQGLSTSTVNLYATLQIKFTPSVKIPPNIIIQDEGADEGTADEGTTDEGTTDPGTTDPGTTDPGTTDPGTTDPGTTDPGTTDPGTDTPSTPTYPTLEPPTPHGEIWIEFGPLLTWDNDLGISTLFCLTDLVPLEQYSIDCEIYQGSSTTLPEIRLKNFKEISENTAINVKVTGICNPELSPISLTIFSGIRQYSNRIIYDYATISITMTTIVPLTELTLTSSFSTSAQAVNQLFNLVFQPGFTGAIPVGSVIRIQLPGYENGFLQDTTKCTVDTTDMTCNKFRKIDWVEIPLTSSASTTSIITLSNLKWPTTSTAFGYAHWVVFTSNMETSKAVVQGSGATYFPAPNANDFNSATIIQYQTGRGYPGQIFKFEFSVNNDIPAGATMRVQFPNEFALRASNPTPTCNGFDPDEIELTQIPAKTIFQIICLGIKTPTSPPDNESDGWSAYIYIDGRMLNQRQNFFSYFYTNVFSQGTINILQLFAIPLNINEIATYTIEFQPENSLLIGAEIHVTFPSSNFDDLPYPPNLADCDVEGGVDSFQSCLLDGSSFIIVLNKMYESGTIKFMINNIRNPPDLISDGFIIKSYYDGVLIDSTDESTLLNRTITYYSKPKSLVINQMSFQPQNQGVRAQYKFNISTETSDSVNGSIVITFPNTYDKRLGDNLKAFVNTIKTDLSVNNRILSLPESQYSTQYNSILVEIQNVINPNTDENSNTGEFRVGIRQSGRYTHYNGSVGVLEMLTPPGWLYLVNIQLANQYSRWQSKYVYDMILYNKIPINGYLEMDFPEDYEISDQNAICSFSKCTFSSNILKAYADQINGPLQLYVYVENPLSEVSIKQFVMQSKDDRQVIEQSYPNLDPFEFEFQYSGPLIYINNDQDIIVPQGSESPDLLFLVEYPMALNLTFKHTQTGDFQVTPKDIVFSYTKMSTTFRVQIPSTLQTGIYYIYWKTYGEKDNPIYTPIKKSKVIVISQSLNFQVTALYPIPNGGNSLTMTISTVYAPYDTTNVTIKNNDNTFYFVAGQQSGSSIKLTFQLGINSQTFRVYQNYTELIRQTQLDILTEDDRLIFYSNDNPLYTIPSQQIVRYIDATNLKPKLSKFSVEDIKQYSASIAIEINQISEAYYMYCLNRTTIPEISELLSLGPPLYMSSQSKYGYLNILAKSSITLDLFAQTDYSFYLVLKNQEGITSDLFSLNFTTKNRSKIAQFNCFLPFQANQAQIVTLMNHIAFILSLPSWKIQQKVQYQTPTRLLATTSLQLYIIPFNDTDTYPVPKDLISKITSDAQFKRLLNMYLPFVSISAINQAVAEIPTIQSSTLSNSFLYDCEIQVSLSNYGYIFAVASQSEISTPFQIFKGLNNINVQIPSTNVHITNFTIASSFNLSNLEPNQTYSIYIISASDLPEYPDLSDAVQTLQCTTKKLTDRAPLEIVYNQILLVCLIIYFIFI